MIDLTLDVLIFSLFDHDTIARWSARTCVKFATSRNPFGTSQSRGKKHLGNFSLSPSKSGQCSNVHSLFHVD